MADLRTKYLGMELKNPIIIASSGLTDSVEGVKKLADNGAAAVVLKSIFEEEILIEAERARKEKMKSHEMRETFDYIDNHLKGINLSNYVNLIRDSKKEVNIPVIASINCVSDHEWTYFAKQMEEAGADALELNMFILPTDLEKSAQEREKLYFQIIEKITREVNIPVALKVSYYFTNLAQMLQKMSNTDIAGLVLFNRYFSPDFDIDNFEVIASNVLSSPTEFARSLRWISICCGRVNCDLAATTGIHDYRSVIKQILAGANAVQIATIIYKKGPEYIRTILDNMNEWMDEHRFSNPDQLRGKLAQQKAKNPAEFDRMQFMKYFSGKF